MKRVHLLTGLILTGVTLQAFAAEMTGRQIMEKADKVNRPKDEIIMRTMAIMDDRGQVREREMTTYFKAGEGDDDKTLIKFTAPTDLRGVGLLTIEEGSKDDQWLYLPKNKKTKRIAGASKADSFMGSNFSNFDMRTEDLQGHKYKRVGKETFSKRPVWVVEATPKNDAMKEMTGYSKRVLKVDAERWTVMEVKYYDLKGKHLKTLRASAWKQYGKLWRAEKVEVRSAVDKSRTMLKKAKRKIDSGLKDSQFSKRALEKMD